MEAETLASEQTLTKVLRKILLGATPRTPLPLCSLRQLFTSLSNTRHANCEPRFAMLLIRLS